MRRFDQVGGEGVPKGVAGGSPCQACRNHSAGLRADDLIEACDNLLNDLRRRAAELLRQARH